MHDLTFYQQNRGDEQAFPPQVLIFSFPIPILQSKKFFTMPFSEAKLRIIHDRFPVSRFDNLPEPSHFPAIVLVSKKDGEDGDISLSSSALRLDDVIGGVLKRAMAEAEFKAGAGSSLIVRAKKEQSCWSVRKRKRMLARKQKILVATYLPHWVKHRFPMPRLSLMKVRRIGLPKSHMGRCWLPTRLVTILPRGEGHAQTVQLDGGFNSCG